MLCSNIRLNQSQYDKVELIKLTKIGISHPLQYQVQQIPV